MSLRTASAAIEWPAWREPLIEKLVGQLKEANEGLKKNPSSQGYLSNRGDVYLFLDAYPEAIADFEKMIKLQPDLDAQHWRLGLAYYFAGQYDKAERQFQKYYAYYGLDRETGIWKFLAQEKIDGIDKARAEMLTYKEFDREPFPELYDMYAGKRAPDDVLAELDKKELTKDEQVKFFANYYVGLYEDLLGHKQRALELLRKAVDIMPQRETVYMWNIARIQWEQLVRDHTEGRF